MRVKLFYANGTSWALNWIEVGFRLDQSFGKIYWDNSQQPEFETSATVLGLDGRSASFDGYHPPNDPFPVLLDPDVFDAERISYPAAFLPMGNSMAYGIQQVIDGINAMPVGQPFALGGYSQGAAVMSTVYNEIRYGSLTSRASTFLGGVMFGNPRRQQDYRGGVGGTWSGLWYDDNATTGGRGSFPATGNYARLANCDGDEWIEFAYPGDVFTCNGSSTLGDNWMAGNDALTDLDASEIIAYLANIGPISEAVGQAFAKGDEVTPGMTDGAGQDVYVTGSGHTAYPFMPPIGVATTDTCYQVALQWLHDKAAAWATAPVLSPKAGWSTTLLPPVI